MWDWWTGYQCYSWNELVHRKATFQRVFKACYQTFHSPWDFFSLFNKNNFQHHMCSRYRGLPKQVGLKAALVYLILIRGFMANTLGVFKTFILGECIFATLLKRLMKKPLICELRSLVWHRVKLQPQYPLETQPACRHSLAATCHRLSGINPTFFTRWTLQETSSTSRKIPLPFIICSCHCDSLVRKLRQSW